MASYLLGSVQALLGGEDGEALLEEGWHVVAAPRPCVLSKPGGAGAGAGAGAALEVGERVFVTESCVVGGAAYSRLFKGGWVASASLRREAAAAAASDHAKRIPNAAAFEADMDDEICPNMSALVRTRSIGSPDGFIENYDGDAPEAGWYAAVAAVDVYESATFAAVARTLSPGTRVFVVLAKKTEFGRRARCHGGGWIDYGPLEKLRDPPAPPPPDDAAWSTWSSSSSAAAEDGGLGRTTVGWYEDRGAAVFVVQRLANDRLKLADGGEIDAATARPLATLRRTSSIRAVELARAKDSLRDKEKEAPPGAGEGAARKPGLARADAIGSGAGLVPLDDGGDDDNAASQ